MKQIISNTTVTTLEAEPVFIEVKGCLLDILPFTLGFLELCMDKDICDPTAVDTYVRAATTTASTILFDVGKVKLTKKEKEVVQSQIFTTLIKVLCRGQMGEA